jgi:peroxiredoxin
MKKWLFSTTALVALLAFTVAGDKNKGMSGPHAGDMAPAFALQDQDGKNVSLADFSGKIVVIEWFNNECPFVIKHYKNGDMNALASKYAGKEVVWLAINSTSGKTTADNKTIATEWKIDRPILMDDSGAVGKNYGSKNTPTMYIVDKTGKLAYRGAIDDKNDPNPASIKSSKNYVSQALDEILAGKTVSEPETKAYGCSVKYAN